MEDDNQEMCKLTQNAKDKSFPCENLQKRVSEEGYEELPQEKKHYLRHGNLNDKENGKHDHELDHNHEHEHEHEHFHYHGGKTQLIITTVGLVVHSLSDGFALGSATYSDISNSSNLHLIIYIALLLHKCPAAIGLSTFLLHEGLK